MTDFAVVSYRWAAGWRRKKKKSVENALPVGRDCFCTTQIMQRNPDKREPLMKEMSLSDIGRSGWSQLSSRSDREDSGAGEGGLDRPTHNPRRFPGFSVWALGCDAEDLH